MKVRVVVRMNIRLQTKNLISQCVMNSMTRWEK